MKTSEFEFVPGPVFTEILLADEINRATPKTQSGLLECMEERQVTIDGKTYKLEPPFMVIATQNPVETLGTFPLPEAQLDRFLMKTGMNYPSHGECVDILARFDRADPLSELKPVVSSDELKDAIASLPDIYICRELMDYIAAVCEATRRYPHVILGVSPRGALALMRASKGYAALSGRGYVTPDDIKRAAHPVLDHRILLESAARLRKNAAAAVTDDCMSGIRVPTEAVFEG